MTSYGARAMTATLRSETVIEIDMQLEEKVSFVVFASLGSILLGVNGGRMDVMEKTFGFSAQ